MNNLTINIKGNDIERIYTKTACWCLHLQSVRWEWLY